MISIKPRNAPYGDCKQLGISNILNYKKYRYFETIWKQCGLIYVRDTERSIGMLQSEFLNSEDDMLWLHQAEIIVETATEDCEFADNIKRHIQNDNPIILYIDTYYLGHHPLNDRSHLPHIITTINWEGDLATFIDDAYSYQGTISLEEIKVALIKPEEKVMEYRYISLENARTLDYEDYLKAIRMNNLFIEHMNKEKLAMQVERMTGRPIFNFKDHDIVIGIPAIHAYLEDLERLIEKGQEVGEDQMLLMYRSLVGVSNNHGLYAFFLEEASRYNEDLLPVIEDYKAIAQDWRVAGNMMLKGMNKNQKVMLQRAHQKITCIGEKELDLLLRINELV